MKPFGLVLDERLLAYHLGNSHPMNSDRVFPAFKLFEELFVDIRESNFQLVIPSSFDKDFLYKAHDAEYIATMERLSKAGVGTAFHYGLGTGDCPVWPGMAEASEFVVGSSVASAKAVYQGKFDYSFVLLGGLHHASTNKASGFCYYNDINVAIHQLKALKPDIRILYLDTDLHHGDGTQFDFYNDPNVLTVSFHESGQFLFPGTGFSNEIGQGDGKGSSINLPFMPYTWDGLYQEAFEAKVPALFESYKPDFVIWQAGVDGHKLDHLGHLQLTTNTYSYMADRVRTLAEENMDRPQVLALGGGGYNPDSVARSWAHIVAGLSKTRLPIMASQRWQESCEELNLHVTPTLADKKSVPMHTEQDQVILEGNAFYNDEFQKYISSYYSI